MTGYKTNTKMENEKDDLCGKKKEKESGRRDRKLGGARTRQERPLPTVQPQGA